MENEPAWVGMNELKPADQHVHLVEEVLELDGFPVELSDWHFGSDMAKFSINPDTPWARSWVVCVDLDKKWCEVTYLLILSPELEVIAKRVLSVNHVLPSDFAQELTKELNGLVEEKVLGEISTLLAGCSNTAVQNNNNS